MTRRGIGVERAFAVAIVGGIVWCAWFLATRGHLPPPFFYEPSDTYADWFNTAFWSRGIGAYDVWRTIYPPISFVFTRAFGMDQCYPDRRPYDFSAGLAARDCDWVGLATIWALLAINVALLWLSFRKADRATALPRTICVGLGFPMLNAVERGNLVLISFTCLVLALGPLLRSARARWAFAGLAINFKVYLIAAVVPLLLKRRWRWVEGAVIATVIVYLLSFAAFGGRGTPMEIVRNIRDFSSQPATNILDGWYTTTYQPLVSLLREGNFPFVLLIGSRNVDLLLLLLPALQRFGQVMIVAAAVATWLRPEAVPPWRVVNLGVLMALITSEPGGYTQMYFMLFVMFERFEGFGRRWAIIACYVLALPLDIPFDRAPPAQRDSYLAGGTIEMTLWLTVGPFIRPLIIITIAAALAATTIRAVWRDFDGQGWAGRWRFRHDAPLARWVEPPRRP